MNYSIRIPSVHTITNTVQATVNNMLQCSYVFGVNQFDYTNKSNRTMNFNNLALSATDCGVLLCQR